jgi:hypothetical protein
LEKPVKAAIGRAGPDDAAGNLLESGCEEGVEWFDVAAVGDNLEGGGVVVSEAGAVPFGWGEP